MSGRPHGGLGVLWRKTLGALCSVRVLDDNRLLILEISNGHHQIVLLNVYLPCDNGSNLEDYRFYLSKVDSLIGNTPYSAAFGDFNANIKSSTHRFGKELVHFCETENLIISDSIIGDKDKFTFYSEAHDSTAWLDHLVSSSSFHSLIENIYVDNSLVSSDHFPIFVHLNVDQVNFVNSHPAVCENKKRIMWSEVSDHEIGKYTDASNMCFSGVILDHSLILCDDPLCTDPEHVSAINLMYSQITEALASADIHLIETKDKLFKQVPSWNNLCADEVYQGTIQTVSQAVQSDI